MNRKYVIRGHAILHFLLRERIRHSAHNFKSPTHEKASSRMNEIAHYNALKPTIELHYFGKVRLMRGRTYLCDDRIQMVDLRDTPHFQIMFVD